MRFAFPALLVGLAVTATSAQLDGLAPGLFSDISTNCLGGIASLLSNSDLNSCLHLSQAISSFGAVGQNDSLVPPLSQFLSSQICPNAPCSQSVLTSANDSVNQACSDELQSESSPVSSLAYLFDNYDAIRTAGCLEDTTQNDELCLSQSLNNIQSATGMNLSLSTLASLNASSAELLFNGVSGNQSVLCTDCNRALFSTLSPLLAANSSTDSAQLESTFTQQCGGELATNGSLPSSIRSSASGTSSDSSRDGNSDGAAAGTSVSLVTATLAALSVGALALLV